jgi:predicted phage terminase large subunit-like protein
LIEFICWAVGRQRDAAAFGIFSYNDTVATERSMSARDVVWSSEPTEMNERYNLVFPGMRPAKERPWSQDRWFLSRKDVGRKDPTMVAAGMGGSVNARRLGGMLLDDPHNWENSRTPHMLAQVRASYNTTARTRLMADGWKACISTRWAEPDLAGYFMELGWPTLRTPALDENDQSTWEYEGPNLGYRTEDLKKLREDDPHSFLLQYQGTIVPPEGQGLIPVPRQVWEVPQRFAKVVQSWDTALELKESSSETAVTTWGKSFDGRVFWLDAWAGHIGYNELFDKVQEKYLEFDAKNQTPDVVLIEQASSGGPLIQQARFATSLPIKGVPVGGRGRTKNERVMSVAKYFETHVFVPAGAHWKGKALGQILTYPEGKDDILQSAIHALHYLFPPMKAVQPMTIKRVLSY